MKLKNNNQGFTLLEMLLVIAIVAILAGIVIVSINPGRQLAQTRNSKRWNDLRALHSAVQQYYIDNKAWPTTTMPSVLTEVCDESGEPAGTCLNLNSLVPTYISAIPRDPSLNSTTAGTNYRLAINPNTITPELVAPSSTEYQLDLVAIGTTTLSQSQSVSLICGDPLIDNRDGQSYATVLIGTQCWMQENLNVGNLIAGSSGMLNNGTIEKYCYNNDTNICDTDGGLYQWDEAMQYVTTAGTQGICPAGWHIPTHSEFTTLERSICNSLGNSNCSTTFPEDVLTFGFRGTSEGLYLKDMLGDWKGFLSGLRLTGSLFYDRLTMMYFWSSTEDGSTKTWSRYVDNGNPGVNRNSYTRTYGFSVRCLKN